jgi:hypothetical protein
VKDGKGTFGYNAATGDYGDMLEMGILDPTRSRVSRWQNAASVAGLLLTTEVKNCGVAEDETKARHAGMGDMGGMGGWDVTPRVTRLSRRETLSRDKGRRQRRPLSCEDGSSRYDPDVTTRRQIGSWRCGTHGRADCVVSGRLLEHRQGRGLGIRRAAAG